MSLYSKFFPYYYSTKKSLPTRFWFVARFKFNFTVSDKEAPRCARRRAAFTLEAAVIMPLLASFFVSLLFFFRVMQVEVEVKKALSDTTRELAVMAVKDETAGELLLAKALFIKNMQGRSEAASYVSGGIAGISLAKSAFAGYEIDLKAQYRMKLPVTIFGKKSFKFIQQASGRKWVGQTADEGAEEVWVYITETGTVYHRLRTCSHLTLSVHSIPAAQITDARNDNDNKYRECSLCAGKNIENGQVYITDEGDCYHTDISCSGLKRTIQMVRLSDLTGWRGCSRCGGEN